MAVIPKIAALLLLWCGTVAVTGHGRLSEPPSRASAWRYGFPTPPDYDDNQGFCGGKQHQHTTNGGACGVCGDPWDASPRQHELGGKYATGTIVRTYRVGQQIPVTVQITANHKGYFEFRICPITNPEEEATQECLNRTPLLAVGHSSHQVAINDSVGDHEVLLQLPRSLTCSHCVLQWRYVAGNDWGVCSDGTGALGCGPQEEFRACADVGVGGQSTSTGSVNPEVTTRRPRQMTHGQPGDRATFAEGNHQSPPTEEPVTVHTIVTGVSSSDRRPPTLLPTALHCVAGGLWRNVPGMGAWCNRNCNHRPAFCPSSHCRCV